MDREELIWAAGFFDGEGHTGYATRPRTGGIEPHISIAQVDREVLDRFRDAVGLGSVQGPIDGRQPNQRPQYFWRVGSFEHVQAVIAMLWFQLGTVKRQQAAATLRAVQEWRTRPDFRKRVVPTHCGQGHTMAGTNLYVWREQRLCKLCRRDALRRFRLRSA